MIWKNFVCICHFINVIFNVISANFNAIDAVGIYINAIFDIIVVILTSINIDTQINLTANELRLPQSGSFYFINNSWNAASPMLDQVHISKCMSKSFISDFGIPFFHTLHRLSHWQLSRRSDFQSVVIYRNLYRTMIQIAAMYHGIDNQLTNSIRWNFINILPINSHKRSPQVNVSQDKLKCFIYLLPKRAGIFSTVNKYRFCCTFEHTTLCCGMKSSVASQNSKGIGRIIFSVTLNQNPPRTQLLSANIFDRCFLFLIMSVFHCLFLHGFAKSINIFICNR